MIKAYGQDVFDLLAERPEQLVMFQAADVRFGSLADIIQRQRHVRFTPDSGHSSVPVGLSGHRSRQAASRYACRKQECA